MKFRKIMAGVLAGAVAAGTMIFAASAQEVDLRSETKALLDTGGGVYLTKSGSPAYVYIKDKGIKVSNRSADWATIDFKLDAFEVGKTYKLTAEFTSDDATQFGICIPDSPYGTVVTSKKDVTSAKLSYEFTVVAGTGKNEGKNAVIMEKQEDNKPTSEQNRIRLGTPNGAKPDYYLKSLDVAEIGGGADETLATEPESSTVVIAPDVTTPAQQPATVSVAKASGLKAGTVSKSGSVKLTWSKANNATQYVVEQKTGSGAWKAVKTTKNTSFTVKGLAKGTTYKFRIRPAAKSGSKTVYGSRSSSVTVKVAK